MDLSFYNCYMATIGVIRFLLCPSPFSPSPSQSARPRYSGTRSHFPDFPPVTRRCRRCIQRLRLRPLDLTSPTDAGVIPHHTHPTDHTAASLRQQLPLAVAFFILGVRSFTAVAPSISRRLSPRHLSVLGVRAVQERVDGAAQRHGHGNGGVYDAR